MSVAGTDLDIRCGAMSATAIGRRADARSVLSNRRRLTLSSPRLRLPVAMQHRYSYL